MSESESFISVKMSTYIHNLAQRKTGIMSKAQMKCTSYRLDNFLNQQPKISTKKILNFIYQILWVMLLFEHYICSTS